MRSTTPDFVSDRMKETRESRGLTQSALAEMIGVTRQAVSQYEKYESAPSPSTMTRAATVLRFPEHRFTRPLPDRPEGASFFRSLATATKTARTRARRRYGWLRHDICGYLQRFVHFPSVKFPEFDSPADPERLDRSDIERLATETRRFWNLGDGPISDIVLLLENNGAIVVRQDLGANTLDGYSERSPDDGRPYIILGTNKASAARSRFDAAHELGHIVLHNLVPKSRANTPEMFRLIEKQAHCFASAFLFPSNSFREEFRSPSLDALVTLKSRWRVSVAAMIFRAESTGLLDSNGAKRLRANQNRRWGRQWEPLDDDLVPEQPRLIRRTFDLLLDRGLTSPNAIRDELALFVEDVEDAAGLERGFFGDEVQHIKFPVLRTESATHDLDTPLLPFSRRSTSPTGHGPRSEQSSSFRLQ